MRRCLFALSIVALSAVAPLTVHAAPVSAEASQTAPAKEKEKRSNFPWVVFLPIIIGVTLAIQQGNKAKTSKSASETPDKET